MRFKDEQVQRAFDTLKRYHDELVGKRDETDWDWGRRIAYHTAMQVLIDNCTWSIKMEGMK